MKNSQTLSDPKPFKVSLSPLEMAEVVSPYMGLLIQEYVRQGKDDLSIAEVGKLVRLYMLKYTDKATFRDMMLEDLYKRCSKPVHIGYLVILAIAVHQLFLSGIGKPLETYEGWEADLDKLADILCLPF